MSNDSFLKIGKITNYFGIKGYAKFIYFGDINNFNYKEVFLEKGGKLLSYFIEHWYRHKNYICLKLKDINSINDVEKHLKNREVFIKKEQLPELEEGEYYWFQLINLDVFDVKNNYLGKISEIIETGSNDVFAVRKEGKEILIPYIDEFVKEIDLKNRKVIVEEFEVV